MSRDARPLTGAPSSLAKTLTLPQLVFYGVGSMVGAGIYSVIGAAALEAGHYLWISFLAAGTVALLTVVSYAELAAMFPKAGAEYQYVKIAFPRRRPLSFFAGYLICISAAATAATVALAFAGYARVFVEVPVLPTAFALLAACTLVNIWGIQQSTWVSIALISIEVAGLVAVIGAALFSSSGGSDGESAARAASDLSIAGVAVAASLIFFIYLGFEEVANLAEEAREAVRDVPRALIACVVITTLLYLAVAIAAVHLAPPEELGRSDAPLSEAAGRAAPALVPALAVAALFATASTALISLVSISRMLFGMARDGAMPRPLAVTLPARQTPWAAALVLCGMACLLLPLGEVKTVASVSSFSVLLVFIGVQAAVIVLRFTHEQRHRPFRVPLSIGRVPLPPIAGIVCAGALLTQFPLMVYVTGGAVLGVGALLYFIQHGRPR